MPELTISLPQLKSTELLELIVAAPMPGLGDGPQFADLATWIQTNWRQQSSLANAGLWLLAGHLDESHQISQSIETPEGSFWHGIMHRREGDYWNAKYWFRRVGRHPVLTELAKHDYGAPDTFVDRCEAINRKPAAAPELQSAQWQEWQLLFAHCLD